MIEVEYLCNGWVKKDGVNANLVQYIGLTLDTALVFAFSPLLSWRGKCDVFLLELYLAIDPSNLLSENDVIQLSELQMHV